ncbi:MAG: molybdopterin-binding protein [Salinigranum sp.]
MPLSARNRLSGTVQSVQTEGLVGEVAIELDGGETVTAVITSGSVERLGLSEGDDVEAVVKATEVMVETA